MELKSSTPILRSTLLSRRPHPHAKRVCFFSLFVMLITSVIYWENTFSISHLLDAVPEKVFKEFEVWRPFTAMFVHADNLHFLGNAVSFTGLSFLLYGYYGSFVFPWGALLVGALANVVSLLTYPPNAHLLGMSGAIYVMAAFWLTMYFFIDRRFSAAGRFLRTVGFALILLFPSNVSPNVSYRTHAIGFALGIVFGCIYFVFERKKLRTYERFEYEEVEGWDGT